jgi:tetratricopeptide (TPR) repeat protein
MPAGFRMLVGMAIALSQVTAPPAAIQERLDRARADLFSRAEHVNEDVRELKEVLALDPRSAEGHLLLGVAYSTLGSRDLKGEAIGEFRQALDLDPSLVPVRFYLAHLYLDLGRAARAREELEAALVQAPGNPEFLALLGEAERQMKNPRRAVEVTRQALQADDSFAPARYYLGLALLDLGQRDEAIKELERVVRSGSSVADAYIALGNAYVEAGRATEAVETLNQGLHVDPGRPELRIALARAYRSKGLLDKAEAQLALGMPKRAATPASSDYPYQQVELDFYLERGLVRLQRGQLAAAAEAFKKVLDLEPDHGPANRGLAEVYLRQGLFAKALQHADRAAKAGFPLSEDKLKLLQNGLRTKKPGFAGASAAKPGGGD